MLSATGSSADDRLTIHRLAEGGDSNAFASDVRTGLTAKAKSLSPKYFYDETGSQLFEEITRLPEYYLTRTELKILRDNAPAIKVTPRKPTSRWSDITRKRWTELETAGLLAASGIVAGPTKKSYAPRPSIPALPAYIARAFRTNPKVWQHFQALAPTYRRDFVVWIHTAKRPETRERRIRESIALLSAGQKLGLK
jgi:hypothetical protein